VEQRLQPNADFDALMAHERAISPTLGGRTVFDDKPPRVRRERAQLSLFE
jgi:hypothetical protein